MSDYLPVPMLDLKAQFATIKDELMPAVNQVFEDQRFIMGPWVDKFQQETAEYLNVKHAVGVSSGTDALLLSLMALGVEPGDGVITTPFTFFATAGSIVRLGAVPMFVDIEPGTLNIDPAKIAELLERSDLPAKPKVILPVHIFGQPAMMQPIWDLAQKHGLKVVEDAAQAIGAIYPGPGGGDKSFAGGLGDVGCFSFFPSKNLGAAGDGGLITTNDSELADKLVSMRNHGATGNEKYLNQWVGGNFRLDALQACVLSTKLPHLAAWSDARRRNAADYERMFTEAGLIEAGKISPPVLAWPEEPRSHIFHQYVLRVQEREGVMAALKKANIGHAVYYPKPLHFQKCFAYLGYKPGDLPVAEKACQEVLALPIYPELSMEQKQSVIGVIKDFYAG